jgi:hypothetical protein
MTIDSQRISVAGLAPGSPAEGRAAWHGRVTTARRIAMTGLDRH